MTWFIRDSLCHCAWAQGKSSSVPCLYTCCSTLNFASAEYLLAWLCTSTVPARSWVHLPAELEEERYESLILCWRGHCFEEGLSGVRTEFPAHSLQSPFSLWTYSFSVTRLAFPHPLPPKQQAALPWKTPYSFRSLLHLTHCSPFPSKLCCFTTSSWATQIFLFSQINCSQSSQLFGAWPNRLTLPLTGVCLWSGEFFVVLVQSLLCCIYIMLNHTVLKII